MNRATSFLSLMAAVLVGVAQLHGQTSTNTDLPDSPGVALSAQNATPPAPETFESSSAPTASSSDAAPMSDSVVSNQSPLYPTSHPYLHRVVGAGMGPQPLTAPQKFELAFHSRLSPGAIGSSIFGAGERQLLNSRPHYGTDSGAFGERLGAAELGQVTEAFFSYGLYASVFHDDPHYYIMGPQHSAGSRAMYAASRVILTRNDAGGTSVNWPKLAGITTGQVIVNGYYPPQDRGVGETAGAIGGYIASSVLTLELHEFMPDLMGAVFHKKQTQ